MTKALLILAALIVASMFSEQLSAFFGNIFSSLWNTVLFLIGVSILVYVAIRGG